MTINEIEVTLNTLEARHPNLTEEMLLTLLSSSGWEEKTIQEALVLFKNSHSNTKKPEAVVTNAPKVPDVSPKADLVYFDSTGAPEPELKNFVDDGKDVPIIKDKPIIPKMVNPTVIDLSKKESINPPPIVEKVESKDPQSLVSPIPQEKNQEQKVNLPENLPLKPFESNNHVWPLSRYKEVFHNESAIPPILSSKEAELVEKHKDEHIEEHKHTKIELKRTGFDGEDEGLIFLTGLSLLIIILLLVYMYSNGRI